MALRHAMAVWLPALAVVSLLVFQGAGPRAAPEAQADLSAALAAAARGRDPSADAASGAAQPAAASPAEKAPSAAKATKAKDGQSASALSALAAAAAKAQRAEAAAAAARKAAVAAPLPALPLTDNRNDGEAVFAFGDSITAGWQPDRRVPDGSTSYATYLRQRHFGGEGVDMNIDGSGKGTMWALSNLERYLPPPGERNRVFVMEFGANDHKPDSGADSARESAEAQGELYRALREHAGRVLWMSAPVIDPACTKVVAPDQMDWIEAARQEALANDAQWVPMYDAIDLVPYNGVFDGFDRRNNSDCVHPTPAGHARLADFLHAFIAGRDHWVSPPSGGVLQVQANYTQTVVVPLDAGWSAEAVQAWDSTTNTPVAIAPGWGHTVHLETAQGHRYLVGPAAHAAGQEQATAGATQPAAGDLRAELLASLPLDLPLAPETP